MIQPAGPHVRTASRHGRDEGRRDEARRDEAHRDEAGRDEVRLVLGSAASRVRVRTTDLSGPLCRVSTPAGSGLAPALSVVDGTVQVALRRTGDDGPDTVDVLLDRAVRWRITLAAGAGEQHLDLARGRLSAVELGAGAGLVRVWLPRPSGTVPIRLTGAVGRAEIVAPRGVPVQVRSRGVLATVVVPWAARTDVPAGTALVPPGWAAAADRYRLDAGMGVGILTVRE